MTKFKIPIKNPRQVQGDSSIYTKECLTESLKDYTDRPLEVWDDVNRNLLIGTASEDNPIETDENGFHYLNLEISSPDIADKIKQIVSDVAVFLVGDGIIEYHNRKINTFKLNYTILQYA